MIYLKELSWSNCFSYAADNKIDFTASALTQLVGKNGHGKSSIALILEEVLFNKNSKGIKKADILNRYVKDKFYTISLTFDKDEVSYRIDTKRTSTQTVKLFCNEVDISAHTATATYKMIEDIIGIDHKTFAQIVYQSHAASLEFLTSADTARKKFLIELLDLGIYTKAGEVVKAVNVDLTKELTAAQAKVETISQWINKYASTDLITLDLLPTPEYPSELEEDLVKTKASLSNIESTNKKITQNNTYKNLLDGINVPTNITAPDDVSEFVTKKAVLSSQITTAKALVKKIEGLHGRCPTCMQDINESNYSQLILEQNQLIAGNTRTIKLLETTIASAAEVDKTYKAAIKAQSDWEKYYQLVDKELTNILLDADELRNKVTSVQKLINTKKESISAVTKENSRIEAHNSKIALIQSQLEEMNNDLHANKEVLTKLMNKASKLQILVKTFSTTGLVAFKIENLVKDLEAIANEYLSDLSDGRFQISFQIAGSDKLNVVITDNGVDIDINALSGGERARVNVATLLAIRKLMQSLSQSRINLLILDETISTLDTYGKEKLIEVLLEEENLNTVLVSHDFTHPLLEKVNVIKTNNISRIE